MGTGSAAIETNNSLAATLSPVQDTTPPELVSTSPTDGAILKTVTAVVVTLSDRYSQVDDNAVIASFAVQNSGGQRVNGTVGEANDQFTFTLPSGASFADDTYTVTFISQDTAGNTQPHSFSFTVDGQPPARPVITGGTVTSSVIQERPALNRSDNAAITLTGTREQHTSVSIKRDDQELQNVELGSDAWSVVLSLSQGNNSLEVYLEDQTGNRGESAWVDIFVDSIAPAITSIAPPDNSFLSTPPVSVVVTIQEDGSGLNLAGSTHTLKDGNMMDVPGQWEPSGGNQLTFTPVEQPLPESVYTLVLQFVDLMGNQGTVSQTHFTVDSTPPPAPGITPITSPVHTPQQVISGTKEAYAAILLRQGGQDQEIVGHTAAATWQYPVTLTEGENLFTFVARNRAGQTSDEATISVRYENIPPLPVTTLTVEDDGSGTRAVLGWNGYDEAGQGDIVRYLIYAEPAAFTSVAGLTAKATVNTGTFSVAVAQLARNITYWFAVVPEDLGGLTPLEVVPVSRMLTDIRPPEEVSNLRVQCFEESLTFTWESSLNSAGDLAGYKVYFNGSATSETLPAETTSSNKTGLARTMAYPFRITAYDESGNESSGVTQTGITLLDNPTGLTAEAQSGYVNLVWNAVEPSQYVKYYAIYMSQSAFGTVAGMTPRLTTSTMSTGVAGLSNNVIYHFAVTVVNQADGERKDVTTITAMPVPDTQGPVLSNVKADDLVLNPTGPNPVTKPVKLTANASDPTGVSRVEFAIDGTLLRTDYHGSPNYYCYWNVIPASNGEHTLDITAYDTLSNPTTATYVLTVALAPPPAPVITQLADGSLTNQTTIQVSGTAAPFSEVIMFNNGDDTGQTTAVNASGTFTLTIPLTENTTNQIQAAARYRGDLALTSPWSPGVTVTVDTRIPSSPSHLTAQAKPGGEIKLTWRPPDNTAVKGYKLYRAPHTFAAPEDAELVNPEALLANTTYVDLPSPTDVEYFYRLVTVSYANNESELSQEVVASSDGTRPMATEIKYTTSGAYDPVTGRFAPGMITVLMTVSEPLQTTPFLSITPNQGIPFSIELTKVSELEYTGSFAITSTTPTGMASVLFSGRDLAGNRGTEIQTGDVIQIDTEGPAVSRITIQPVHPVKNDAQSPIEIMVTIGLTEAVPSGNGPELSYTLSGPERTPTAVANLEQVTPQSGEAQAWQGSLTLPADAGIGSAGNLLAEMLQFTYHGVDDLGNVSDTIRCASGDNCGPFQVYQGDLPALAVPSGLTGTALPGGKIKLTWRAVSEAAGYRLYRQAPGESTLTLYQSPWAVTEYVDGNGSVALLDGDYTYTLASVRQANGMETFSAMSAPVTVTSDATLPQPPQNLMLDLDAQGVSVKWDDPVNVEVTYAVYRSEEDIVSVAGMTPIIPNIPAQYLDTGVVDPQPSATAHCYAVTARDVIGNESAPSLSVCENFGLLPVSTLEVLQSDNQAPVISWTHPAPDSIDGYEVYLGPAGQEVKLTPTLLTTFTYTDTGYTGEERRYTIVPVDVQTPPTNDIRRSIVLPKLHATLAAGTTIKRGLMNHVEYRVENLSSATVAGIRLRIRIEAHDNHLSELFSLNPGETRMIPVVIGGYSDLPDLAALTTTIAITPNPGEQVQIVRTSEVEVGNGMLALQIFNKEFTRGINGEVQFTLENTGDEEIEIITASGTSASPEIHYELLDQDGNVLSSAPFTQLLGQGLVSLSNGMTVARIPAGASFSSAPTTLPVPLDAPDDVRIRLTIDHLYYHYSKPEQVTMNKLSRTQPITLIDTSYY